MEYTEKENKYLLKMENIVKIFPGVKALKGVNLKVKYGEIHALMGENGAGKSTLMKCLIGMQPPTEGKIWFEGKHISNYDVRQALEMHIAMIHQELSPIEHRSIMENIWLGREPKNKYGLINHKKMYNMTKDLLRKIHIDEDPNKLMKNLTVAKKQMIEIAKAISYNAKLIIMDEPTSALTDKEVRELFKIIKKLKNQNKGIIYISHKLEEIYEICDTVSVFRDGNFILEKSVSEIKLEELIKAMVGRNVEELFPKVKTKKGEIILEVKNLYSDRDYEDISFKVKRGEILGFSGLVGSGRTEIMESIFGIKKIDKGSIYINGKEVKIKSPCDAIKNGIALLTEDRRNTGIFPVLSVYYNIICSDIDNYKNKVGFLNLKRMLTNVLEYISSIHIKTPNVKAPIENLSGGNQQKVLFARWMMTKPEILILDEPTRGIDVGAKAEIYKLISELANQGKCVIMVSSELPEILGMSDRIVVMHEGSINAILKNDKTVTQELIMRYATGDLKQVVREEIND